MLRRVAEAIKFIIKDPKDWVRVCLRESKWRSVVSYGDDEKFSIWYHLYENSNGVRRYEITYTGKFRGDTYPYRLDKFFLNSVKPWANGIRISGIDSYQTACQQMTMDELKGTK